MPRDRLETSRNKSTRFLASSFCLDGDKVRENTKDMTRILAGNTGTLHVTFTIMADVACRQSPYTVLLYKSPPRGGRVLVIQRKIALVSLKADAVSLTGEPDPRERDSLSGKEHPRIKRTTILTDWYTGNTPLVYSCSSRFPRARARARST